MLKVARIIARLNVGGPAHHVTILTARLPAHGIQSELLVGRPTLKEGSFETIIETSGVRPIEIGGLGPRISPARDALALVGLVRSLRRLRPDLVHTHTAKAGALGRLAALTVRPRPIIVHTYHGHVLEGYFGPAVTYAYRIIERLLARITDRLIAVSNATVDDLVRLKVAPRDRFVVIPLGFDLNDLLAIPMSPDDGARREFGIEPNDVVLTFVGRLVPIKRVDVLLRAFARALKTTSVLRLLVVGDGELRQDMESLASQLGVAERVSFLGFRFDLTTIARATDVAVLSSDNEGTPVALIEAAAAGRPAVATEVGGVSDIVDATTGRTIPARDDSAMADAIAELAGDGELRRTLGEAARERVRKRYEAERLVSDVARLYEELAGRPLI